jgi:uncharacterized protein (DUF1697 family)
MIANAIPATWSKGPELKADVVYLLDDVTGTEALTALSPRDGIDTTVVVDGALLWMVHRSDAARSGLQKIIGTDLYQRSTIRNVNTARRIRDAVDARVHESS